MTSNVLFVFVFYDKWLPYAVSIDTRVNTRPLRNFGALMDVFGIPRPSNIEANFVRRRSTFSGDDVRK